MQSPKYIVVIGASAGGFHSITEVVAQLKPEMNLAVFIVLHVTPNSVTDTLIKRLQKQTTYTCQVAKHLQRIQPNHIYLADSDKHLLVKQNEILLGNGPVENRWRPCIDVLFRSAAAAYDGRVIGIILSGMMQDGTAGMIAIKKSGGTCIVQDPNEAEYPEMPQSVLDNVDVDYCVSLSQIGIILEEKSKSEIESHFIPPEIIAEAAIAEKAAVGINYVSEIAERSLLTCPDCGGGLWEIKEDNFSRYRCHTGHSYTQAELLFKQNASLENTLWVAMRMMEERRILLKKMGEEEINKGWLKSAALKYEREMELVTHIERLKEVLFDSNKKENKIAV